MPGPSIATAPRAFLRALDDSQGFWQLGNLWRVTATGHQTGGSLSFIDQLVTDDGGGPGVHMHNSDEGLYVVSGHFKFSAGRGDFVFVPRGTSHPRRVRSASARVLQLVTPSGFERLLRIVGEETEALILPTTNCVGSPT